MAGPYSTIAINGIQLWADPDTLQESVQNLVHITRSMSGNSLVTYYGNGTGAIKSVTINGLYLPASLAQSLLALAYNKTVVTVTGADISVLGNFIVLNVSRNPMKPRPPLDGLPDGDAYYSYSITLQEV